MALPKWKRRLIWALSIPLGLSLIGWGMLAVAETRVRKAIQAEEFKLELLGLRAKPLTPGEDAAPDYAKAAAAIRAIGQIQEAPSGGGWSYEGEILPDPKVLSALVAASRKPAFLVPTVRAPAKNHPYRDRNLVLGWCSGAAAAPSRTGDVRTLATISDALRHMQRQLALGSDDWFVFDQNKPEPILGSTMFIRYRDTKVRAWVKKRLLDYDMKPLVHAYFSGAILRTRRRVATLKPGARPKDWLDIVRWQLQKTDLFHLMAEYELLNAWNEVAVVELPVVERTGALGDLDAQVRVNLGARARWPATYAKVTMTDPMRFNIGFTLELDRRVGLIEMDLRESFLAHKPLKLTWSAPLLFDPVTGAPLTLRLRRQNQNGASFEILATNGPKLWIGVSVP